MKLKVLILTLLAFFMLGSIPAQLPLETSSLTEVSFVTEEQNRLCRATVFMMQWEMDKKVLKLVETTPDLVRANTSIRLMSCNADNTIKIALTLKKEKKSEKITVCTRTGMWFVFQIIREGDKVKTKALAGDILEPYTEFDCKLWQSKAK